jgi:tetratricopeptide (TPR) repeat protein
MSQVLVDGKSFSPAIKDYDSAISLESSRGDSDPGTLARLYAGRALALEGLSKWEQALMDYDKALDFADRAGFSPDPYIINSRGNIMNSLGRWEEARENYLISSDLFQVWISPVPWLVRVSISPSPPPAASQGL